MKRLGVVSTVALLLALGPVSGLAQQPDEGKPPRQEDAKPQHPQQREEHPQEREQPREQPRSQPDNQRHAEDNARQAQDNDRTIQEQQRNAQENSRRIQEENQKRAQQEQKSQQDQMRQNQKSRNRTPGQNRRRVRKTRSGINAIGSARLVTMTATVPAGIPSRKGGRPHTMDASRKSVSMSTSAENTTSASIARLSSTTGLAFNIAVTGLNWSTPGPQRGAMTTTFTSTTSVISTTSTTRLTPAWRS